MNGKKIPKDKDFVLNNLKTLNKLDLKQYICFTTRNIWHLGHEYILKSLHNKKKKLTKLTRTYITTMCIYI